MEHLNHLLFTRLNASEHPSGYTFFVVVFLAEWLIWAAPIYLCVGWLVGGRRLRLSTLIACLSGLMGLGIAQAIGAGWPHPRPFMIGMGHQWVAHVADASFPSDHLTLWWAVSFGTMTQRCARAAGLVMTLTGVAMAWARIYLGVHFPFDMLGALAVAGVSACLSWGLTPVYLPTAYGLAQRIRAHLFGPLIRRGWMPA